MGYQILYDSGLRKDPGSNAQKSPLGLMAAGAFLTFLLLVTAFWPRGREVLQRLIWPGDRQTTIQAAECFARELHSGEPFWDAAESFCREILTNADNSD